MPEHPYPRDDPEMMVPEPNIGPTRRFDGLVYWLYVKKDLLIPRWTFAWTREQAEAVRSWLVGQGWRARVVPWSDLFAVYARRG